MVEIKQRYVRTKEHAAKLGDSLRGRKHAKERRINESLGHGGILVASLELAQIGLSNLEISRVLLIAAGREISPTRIRGSLRSAVINNYIELPERGIVEGAPSKRTRERIQTKFVKLLSPEVQEEIKERLEHKGLCMPDGLAQKIVLAEFHIARVERTSGTGESLVRFHKERWNIIPVNMRRGLEPLLKVL